LFLISTATFIVSNALITPLLGSPNFLAAVADHSQLMIAATLIGLIEGIATVGIAVALYPILKRQHPALALGYASMRIAELAVAAGSGAGHAGPHRFGGWPGTGLARSRRPVRTPSTDLALREGIQLDRQ